MKKESASKETPEGRSDDHAHDKHGKKHPGGKHAYADELESLRASLAQAETQAEALKDQMLRQLADVDNTKKRLERDKQEFRRYAAEGCIRRLLPVIDSLAQAIRSADGQGPARPLIEGMQLIHRQLLDVLTQEGVSPVKALGERFDPHLHEAVLQTPTQDPGEDQKILEIFQEGYVMHGRLIRSAMVRIAQYSSPAGAGAPESQEQGKNNLQESQNRDQEAE